MMMMVMMLPRRNGGDGGMPLPWVTTELSNYSKHWTSLVTVNAKRGNSKFSLKPDLPYLTYSHPVVDRRPFAHTWN